METVKHSNHSYYHDLVGSEVRVYSARGESSVGKLESDNNEKLILRPCLVNCGVPAIIKGEAGIIPECYIETERPLPINTMVVTQVEPLPDGHMERYFEAITYTSNFLKEKADLERKEREEKVTLN